MREKNAQWQLRAVSFSVIGRGEYLLSVTKVTNGIWFGSEIWLGKAEDFYWICNSPNFVQTASCKQLWTCIGYCTGCKHPMPEGFGQTFYPAGDIDRRA